MARGAAKETVMSVFKRPRLAPTDESENEDLSRVNITINSELKGHIEEVKRNTGKSSISEVFRQAVFFYLVAFREHKKGGEILIRDKNGTVEKLRMFI